MMDLYRVGTPSIGEAYPRRFSYNRGSGGLGTGVYAFRERSAAKQNIGRTSPDKQLHVLHNALENPIQPRTRDATDSLVRLSRVMDLLRVQNDTGDYTYEEAMERPAVSTFSLSSGFTTEMGWGNGSRTVGSVARDVLFNTPELRSRYGYETEDFIRAFIEATQEAERQLDSSKTGIQPINVLLYPEYDGVAPLDGAGGNTGRHGCVIFKQRIDACVGHETESFEEIPAEQLNACWNGGVR